MDHVPGSRPELVKGRPRTLITWTSSLPLETAKASLMSASTSAETLQYSDAFILTFYVMDFPLNTIGLTTPGIAFDMLSIALFLITSLFYLYQARR